MEWPPSPWRLLRAVFATWKERAPQLDAGTVGAVLADLAGLPSYHLPGRWSEAHTRHYLPDRTSGPPAWNSTAKRFDLIRTDKALDAFVVIARDDEVVLRWPVELSPAGRDALGILVNLLPYVGRAESICEGRLLGGKEEPTAGVWCEPMGSSEAAVLDRPPVRVLVPRTPLDLGALVMGTDEVRGQGLLEPPGAYCAAYRLPEQAAVIARARPRREAGSKDKPTAVCWAYDSNARPSMRAAVALGHVLRSACNSKYRKFNGGQRSVVLEGKDAGRRLENDHSHAHYLALDRDHDGLIDHLVAWVPAGLSKEELEALARGDRLWTSEFVADFRPGRLAVEGFGAIADVAPELARKAPVWTSATPFAPPRHAHRNQSWAAHVDEEVRRELRDRHMPAPMAIEQVVGPWLAFRRHRPNKERLEDARRAVGLRLTFAEPLAGPLALGALSHFGLGLFLPEA